MDGPVVKALAYRLQECLAGRTVDRLDVPADRWQANVLLKHCAGQTVRRIYSHGRWLLWDFSHGISWICHPLRGWRWAIQTAASAPILEVSHAADAQGIAIAPLVTRPGRRQLLCLAMMDGPRIVLSGRPLLLVAPTGEVRRHPHLASMGMDILDAQFSPEQWAIDLKRGGRRTMARLLLDQRLAAGIGNPGKCEILFAARLHPATPAAAVSQTHLEQTARTARDLLAARYRAALQFPEPNDGRRYHVYDRDGEPCATCGAPIAVDRSGRDGRWSWYCPSCQAPRPEPTLFTKFAECRSR